MSILRRPSTRRASVLATISGLILLAPAAVAHEDDDPVYSDDGGIYNGESTHGHHGEQHGGHEGHLPSGSENVKLVSKRKVGHLGDGRVADVGVHKGYAYLTAFYEPDCKQGGVYVMDIRNIKRPAQVAFVETSKQSYAGEGSQAITVDTPAFQGDLLAFNNEICPGATAKQANGGMTLVDVSNPHAPVKLAEHAGDIKPSGKANQIHSVFMWDAGDKAYAVMVDDDEWTDVDIMDITDPRNPTLIKEYDLLADFPQIYQPDSGLDEVFHHDMIVKEINGRQIMLISYWDGGYVQLDVTDPMNATYVADTDFANPDPEAAESGLNVPPEGNAHQSEFTADNEYVIAADEDFNPYKGLAKNLDDGTHLAVGSGSDTPTLEDGQEITGGTVFAGRACPGDPAPPPGDPNVVDIAVVERGVCTFTEKVTSVSAAGGYDAILVFNRTAADGCNAGLGMTVAGDIPSFGVAPRVQGYAIFDIEDQYDNDACLAGDGTQQAPIALGTEGDTLTFSSYFDGWGYVRLFQNGTGKLTELDTYAVPEAHDPEHAHGSGDLSVHEIAVSEDQADLAYISYYAAGLRVVRVEDGKLVEKGHFIDEGGNNFWGVQVFHHQGKEYVAASDRDFGIYIFEYTGP